MESTEVLQSCDVFKENFKVLKEIGEGGFGKVSSVRKKETGEKFAAKFIRIDSDTDEKETQKEIGLLKTMNNDFVIKFVDAFGSPKEFIIVTEYLDGGELFYRIVDEEFKLLESDCCFFMSQVCKGLEYLHRNHIVHMDIKVGSTTVNSYKTSPISKIVAITTTESCITIINDLQIRSQKLSNI